MNSGVLPRPRRYPDVVQVPDSDAVAPISQNSIFLQTRGVTGMKTSLLAIMLACALLAGAQVAAQTQPAAPGGADQSAPTIKDPAEYNAYVTAYQQTDVNAKISA